MFRCWTVLGVAVAAVPVAGTVDARDRAGVVVQLEQVADAPGHLYLGEALTLLVTTRNEGRESAKGRFAVGPFGPGIAIRARRPDGTTVRLDELFDPQDLLGKVFVVHPVVLLRPDQATTVRGRFVIDPRSNRLWLSEAGTYQVFVVRRPWEEEPSSELRSNVIRVVVSDPPPPLRAAFEAYMSSGLASLVVDPVQQLQEDPSVVLRAEAFVRAHGEAPYGRQVHSALLEGLRVRVATGTATFFETEAYERIETSESAWRGAGLGYMPLSRARVRMPRPNNAVVSTRPWG
jgi:hypothetical protein